ncbi:MAG: YraN family protein [Thiothrix sp.]|nr:YraN family protein [Thiothrix sp.]HPE59124.1 YraN family protein [Thiolinea sp.]
MPNTRARGLAAEDRACTYLQARGLKLLQRNYRLRSGEIDLIMRDDTHLVFVEVRYRNSKRYGGALQSVDFRKQQRIMRTAQHFLLYNPYDLPVRFDVIALEGQELRWIQHAFEVEL